VTATAIPALVAAALLGALACEPPSDAGPHAAVAKIHRAHCGSCHTRVEPGSRTRAQLEAALAHHHNRVHMTDAEWSEMIDYLAADGVPSPGGASPR
jgi:mono/diheme cytochrome c family protein